MENPVTTVEREKAQRQPKAEVEVKGLSRFENEPFADTLMTIAFRVSPTW